MRERLDALKAHWEENGACHFPWDDVSELLLELEDRVVAIENAGGKGKAAASIEKRLAALEDSATKPDAPKTAPVATPAGGTT